jgi:hypothetical protein
MQKVTKLPIGLGMKRLEQEIAACQAYNHCVDQGISPLSWIPIKGRSQDLFADIMVNAGFIEVSDDSVRLTQKAVDLIEKFVSEQ